MNGNRLAEQLEQLANEDYPDSPDVIGHNPVNHPSHYTSGPLECIDAIEAALTPEEFRGYCKGNALKYVWREKGKGGNEDVAKAGWYLKRLREVKR